MSRKLLSVSVAGMLMGGTVMADVPNVAVDIAPVHSLVARVMDGVGAPSLIIPPGASPHEYSLRPSEASALQEANLVFWIGKDLTPWMEDAVATLAEDASVTTLLEVGEIRLLDFREGALFEAHDHDGEHHDAHAEEDGHGHDDHDHDQHDKVAEAEHDDHAHHDHAGHDHDAHDPHAWLSPQNARIWLDVIAAELSAADPDNAGTYFANAAAAKTEMAVLSTEITEALDPVRNGRFIVFHDAYQYFETDFGLFASGAISIGDAADPSPSRIIEIQGRIRDEGIDCVLAEPQFDPGLVATVLEGTEARTGVIDPLGAALEPGPSLYPQLLRDMTTTLVECL